MRDFRELKVWQKSHRLVLAIYRVTVLFPAEERYGLTEQLRKAVISIAANIVEGTGRSSDAEMARFLWIALGSGAETHYYLLLAHDLGYLKDRESEELTSAAIEIRRMLNTFIQRLRATSGGSRANG